MNCFTHGRVAAVGMCTGCQKVSATRQRRAGGAAGVLCRSCACLGAPSLAYPWRGWPGYGDADEDTLPVTVAGWPLLHVCGGIDPITLRPKVARGVVAIGNIAIGALAIGGLACGLFSVGGASLGLLAAVGGAALGLGVSIGGFAVGSIAIGGAAVGFVYAIGGGAFGPAVIDGRHCDEAARAFARRCFDLPLPNCR